jgi:hypothetical protein
MATESRKVTERSPNFPFITLEAALERAKQFYEKEKRGSAPFAIVAEHWRYSPSSSGALQTAGALKSYGLMADEGGGAGRKLKLTDLALRILLDPRPESSDREQYKRQAALAPAVAAEVYQRWPEQLPSEATLNHHLVLERGFNQSTALRASKIIQQNEAFTKSGHVEVQSAHNESMNDASAVSQSSEASNQWLHGNSAPMVVPKAPSGVQSIERVKDSKNQDIVMQFVGAPTIESYEFLKDYIDLRIKALKRAESAASKDKEKQN